MTTPDQPMDISNLGDGVTTIMAEMDRMRHEIARLRKERDAMAAVVEVLRQYYQRKANDDELYAAFCAWRENPFSTTPPHA